MAVNVVGQWIVDTMPVYEDETGDIPQSCTCDTRWCTEVLLPIGVRMVVQKRIPHTYINGRLIYCDKPDTCDTCLELLPF